MRGGDPGHAAQMIGLRAALEQETRRDSLPPANRSCGQKLDSASAKRPGLDRPSPFQTRRYLISAISGKSSRTVSRQHNASVIGRLGRFVMAKLSGDGCVDPGAKTQPG